MIIYSLYTLTSIESNRRDGTAGNRNYLECGMMLDYLSQGFLNLNLGYRRFRTRIS